MIARNSLPRTPFQPTMRRLLVIAVAALCVPAPAAFAGTFAYEAQDCGAGSRSCATKTVYRAAAGERNDVTFLQEPSGTTVRDAGATVTPGDRCTAIDAHAARCPAYDVTFELGDGDDRVAPAAGLRYTGLVGVDGGPGDDAIAGGERGDYLQGGAGADTLAGGAGDDTLFGNAGADALDGGDGVDRVSYAGEAPVVVDLGDPGPDGPPADPDTLAGIEEVVGTDGDDTLRGDAGPNLLQGGLGDDALDGGAGADRLFGNRGFDRLSGGAGDDDLAADYRGDPGVTRPPDSAREATGEPVSCGAGEDRVSEQAGDILQGCERLELPLGFLAPAFDPRPRPAKRAARLQLRCTLLLRAAPLPCRVRVTLSAGGRRLANTTVRLQAGTTTARVPLRRALPATVRVTLRYLGTVPAFDDQTTTTYLIRR